MRKLRILFLSLYVSLLVLLPVTLHAQENTGNESMQSQEQISSFQPIWTQLDQLLTELSQEALLQNEDLQKLSTVLEQSRNEISELQSLLTQSEQQLANLEQLLKTEQKQRNLWQTIATVEGGVIVALIITSIILWGF